MEVLSLVICMAAYPENASKNFVPFSFPKITLCQIGAKSRVAIYSTFKISSIRTSFGKSFWKTVSCWKNRDSAALSSSLEIYMSYISSDQIPAFLIDFVHFASHIVYFSAPQSFNPKNIYIERKKFYQIFLII